MAWFGNKKKEQQEWDKQREQSARENQQFVATYLNSVKIATDPSSSKEPLLPALKMLATYGRDSVPGVQRISMPTNDINTGHRTEVIAAAENIHKLIMSPDEEIGDAALAAMRGLLRQFDHFGPDTYKEFRESDFDPRTAPPESTQPSDWYKTSQPGKSEEPGSLNHQPLDGTERGSA